MTYQTGFTVADLQALEKALISGEKRVKYNDKEVEFRSVKELKEIIAMTKQALCLDKSTGKKGLFGGRRINAIHSKGLD